MLSKKKNKISHYFFLIFLNLIINSCSDAQPASSTYREKGIASFYANSFHGLLTANGEIFNNLDFTAAHKTLTFNTILLVTNLENGKSVVVRVNDRGPFAKNRIIDLSRPAARKLGMMDDGIIEVDIQELNVINLSQNLKENFQKNKILDINGKSGKLHSVSVSIWSSYHLEHVMYMAINLKLNYDLDKIYIQGKGVGNSKKYSIIATGIKSKDVAAKLVEQLKKDGFSKADIK